jgi:hypothetical protein
MFPSLKKLNLDKICKEMLAAAVKSLLEDAKLHERKAESCRMTAALLKQLAPVLKDIMNPKPFKVPKMTKKQKAAMKKAMAMYGGQPVPVAVAARPA